VSAARIVGTRGSNRRWWAWILILFLAATVVRVGYVEIFRSDRVFGTFPTIDGKVTPITGVEIKQLWGDGYVYSNQANLLVDGKGLIAPLPYYLTGVQQEAADHPPLYVLYLAFWSLLGFRSELSHMLLSAPFAALCVPTFALLARRLWSPRAGLIAAVIGAFNPSIIHFPGFALSETMTLPLVALLTLFLYRLWDRRTWTDAAVSGFLVGLTSLCRPDIAVMAPFAVLPIVLLLRSTAFRRKLAYLTVAGVACAAPLLPWFAFNLARYENTVLLSVGFDYSLTQGSCDQSYYGELIGYYWLPCMGERLEGTDLEYADQSIGASHLRHETMAYIRDHLAWTPVVMAARVGRVTGVFRPIQQANLEHITEDREWWLSNAAVVSYYPLAVLSAVGAVVLRRRRRLTLPLLVTIASALAGAATTLAVLRYRASAEPALAVLAAVAIDAVITWVQRGWRDGSTPTPEPGSESTPDLPPVAERAM
jgi:4-amino-4-deoxy-L-arabinose transferase-like glycosyltransferase